MSHTRTCRRFMLLAAARTGSNLLMSLLSRHRSIKTHGEVFNLDELPRRCLTKAVDDPLQYLHDRVYRANPHSDISVVGFKMFYYHLRPEFFLPAADGFFRTHHLHDVSGEISRALNVRYTPDQWAAACAQVWRHLIADRTLAIIHLRRLRTLDALVSHKIALKTDRWWNVTGTAEPDTTIQIDVQECRQWFERLDQFMADSDCAFRAHPVLHVTYEGLVTERDRTLSSVFDFLKVPSRPVATSMHKQNGAPLSRTVENYDALKCAFRGTQWAWQFE